MQLTEHGTAPSRSPKEGPICPRCGGEDLGYHAGYLFTSVPDPTPVWEEVVWCEGCGWSEESVDGRPAGGAIDDFLAALPALPESDDDIPPF